MTIVPRIEHVHWQGSIYSTNFYGEREALERSDFLRPLLPPEGRRYIKYRQAFLDGEAVSNRINSCHRKHGGILVRVGWATYSWDLPIRVLTKEEIIDLARRVMAEIQDQPQVNAAPADWPFPVWRAAA
ncbi:hypothetical protein ACMHYJ_05270 [Castellaniella hirudinis]|uniref:hypothetical protein n=1 Tax=Castellaniella hirudinis TaxID=1144617 RepID=UPI0039C426A4